MYIAFIVLIFVASVLLILAVLAQNPKGGMAANFGVSNQVMGVRQTTDFLEKSTWGLAIAILLFSLGATMTMPKGNIEGSRGAMEEAILGEPEVGAIDSLTTAVVDGDSVVVSPDQTLSIPVEIPSAE